jgi:hypothetical protein
MLLLVGFGPSIFFFRCRWRLKLLAGIVWLANLAMLIIVGTAMSTVVG